jgi:uncharacterized protein (TIGR02270 family)
MAVIWDIHQQYLREAEFLFEMWESSLDSPNFVLDEVLRGPEHRLVTKIDALVIGGEEVVEHMLLPLLENPRADELRARAASLTILVSASLSACERVLAALSKAPEPVQRGTIRALQLAQRDGLVNWIARDLATQSGLGLAGRLEALAGLRVDLGARVRPWMESDDPQVVVAASKLAKHSSDADSVRSLAQHLHTADPELRRIALESALARWLPGIWELVCMLARECEHAGLRESCRLWIAMLGNVEAHEWLLARVKEQPSTSSLRAAGVTGRVAAVDVAIEYLDHESLARVAGEVVSAVAGLPTNDDRYWLDHGAAASFGELADQALPPLLDDDLNANLVPTPEDYLRLPNARAVREWWFDRRGEFSADVRYLAGGVREAARVSTCLLDLPTRRRHALAQELAFRSAGRVSLDTRTWVRLQRMQIDAAGPDLQRLEYQRGMQMN